MPDTAIRVENLSKRYRIGLKEQVHDTFGAAVADRAVDFSGMEKFVNTPVKFYSSGMQVRLAFAVATHPEPGDQTGAM